GDVIVTEVVAKNDSIEINDNYPDYFELYNEGGDTVNLQGLWLSDKSDVLTKHQVRQSIPMAPGEYQVFTADGGSGDTPYSVGFKLKSAGEGVYLSPDGVSVSDSVTWTDLPLNVALGLCENGWKEQRPTPHLPNDCEVPTGVNSSELSINLLTPNPSGNYITIPEEVNVMFTDILGKNIVEAYAGQRIYLPQGMYVCVFTRQGSNEPIGTQKLIVQ
ncbi:MAG: lamin tail domain-containing protein, partial [Bacteroidetes bacterium]|nr:lamin tail domain-containing protein [Bacteroidota bacterium]